MAVRNPVKNPAKAKELADAAILKILRGIKSRQDNQIVDRWGIGTAASYLRKLLTPGFAKPDGWDDMLKAAESRLVYCSPKMLVEKEAGGKFDPTPHAILEFNCIVTTKNMDRDGDVMHPDGANLDPMCALLWQHMPDQPIGKLVKELSKNDQALRSRFAIADTALGKDSAVLVEFGALRISHGFLPLKFSPRTSKSADGVEWEGWDISKYDIMEVSLVSVPSNVDSVITAFSRQKLCTPMVKSWAKGLFDARPVQVAVADLQAKSLADSEDKSFKSCGNPLIDSLFKKEHAVSNPDDNGDGGTDDQLLWCPECEEMVMADADDECPECGSDLTDAASEPPDSKAKKPKKPKLSEDDDDPDNDTDDTNGQYSDDDDGVGISEMAVHKCAAGINGCEHFGQAFVNHAMKSVHHTMCSKCVSVPMMKGGKTLTKDADNAGDDNQPQDQFYDTADDIHAAYSQVAGVQHVTVAKEYHPPLGRGWSQCYPVSQPWVAAINAGGPGEIQNNNNSNDGNAGGGNGNGGKPNTKPGFGNPDQNGKSANKSVATLGKKFLDCFGPRGCGDLPGSWDETVSKLRASLYDYLASHGLDDMPVMDESSDPSIPMPWVSICGMFDDHAIVCVYYPMAAKGSDSQPCYMLSWKDSAVASMWDGEPVPVVVMTNITVTAADMSKALQSMRTKAKDDSKCSHLNKDGTFKGGFDGCVEHMTDSCGGSHSEESAKAICGKIAQEVGKEHRAEVESVEAFAEFKSLWRHGGIEAIGGKLKTGLKKPAEIQSFKFDVSQWTPEQAKAWLKANDYEVKTWTDAAREAAAAVRQALGGHAQDKADSASNEANSASASAHERSAEAAKSGKPEDHEIAAQSHVNAMLENDHAARMQHEAGNDAKASEHKAQSEAHMNQALHHKITAAGMHDQQGRFGFAGGKPEGSSKPVDAAKLADQIQKDDKAGRVLSAGNMQHIQEAMDCHNEILKMGPEHASKVCKTMVREAHGHLNDVITAAGPSATEPTVKEIVIGDVSAFLASASSEDIDEAHAMIQARKRRNGSHGERRLLERLLGR